MNWTAEEIRQLRYRLGWSQAEMARRLNLEISILSGFETGRASVPGHLKGSLLQILSLAESNADRVQRRPIAEVMMRDRGLSQIHDFDVQNSGPETAPRNPKSGLEPNA